MQHHELVSFAVELEDRLSALEDHIHNRPPKCGCGRPIWTKSGPGPEFLCEVCQTKTGQP